MTYSPVSFGPNSTGSAASLQTTYQNGTGSTIAIGTPVSVNTSGQLALVDVTSDQSVAGIVGLMAQSTPTTAYGLVCDSGRLENVTTSFSVGDAIYINTDGTLTNVRPSVGVGSWAEGMYCVFVGVLVKNQFNPSNTDIKIYMEVVGQL